VFHFPSKVADPRPLVILSARENGARRRVKREQTKTVFPKSLVWLRRRFFPLSLKGSQLWRQWHGFGSFTAAFPLDPTGSEQALDLAAKLQRDRITARRLAQPANGGS
jgi:hypothetical protein